MFLAIIIMRTSIIKYNPIKANPPKKPYSSIMIAKIKSEADCGKDETNALLPGPTPLKLP